MQVLKTKSRKKKLLVLEGRFDLDASWKSHNPCYNPCWYEEMESFRAKNKVPNKNTKLHIFATNFLAHFCDFHQLKATGLTWRYILQEFDNEDGEHDRLGGLHSDLTYITREVIAAYLIVEAPEQPKLPECGVEWRPYTGAPAGEYEDFRANFKEGEGYYTTDDVSNVFTHQTKVGESVTRKWALIIGTVSQDKSDQINFDARKLRFGADLHWRRDSDGRVVAMNTLW
jgi:hypothetical protein